MRDNKKRPLSKLASVRGFEGDSERRTAVYKEVHEDSSTEPTYKSPTEVEFLKRSNLKYKNYTILILLLLFMAIMFGLTIVKMSH